MRWGTGTRLANISDLSLTLLHHAGLNSAMIYTRTKECFNILLLTQLSQLELSFQVLI
jgi:hypothetical protein